MSEPVMQLPKLPGEIWFRPYWPQADSVERWHVYKPSLDSEEHALCGTSWPRKLNHGMFQRDIGDEVPDVPCRNCLHLRATA